MSWSISGRSATVQATGYRRVVFLTSGLYFAMRERTRTLWSSNPNVFSELIRNLIPGMYALVLVDGKGPFSFQEYGINYPIACPVDAQVSHSCPAESHDLHIYTTGFFLAHSTVWLMCVQSLAAFDISKHVENGVEVTPEFNQEGATIMLVFTCCLTWYSLSLTSVSHSSAIRRLSNVRSSPDRRRPNVSSGRNSRCRVAESTE